MPLNMRCVRCGKGFVPSDQGFEMPFADFEHKRVKAIYYHKGCLLREIGVVHGGERVDAQPGEAAPTAPSQPTPADEARSLRDTLQKVASEGVKGMRSGTKSTK